MPDAIASAIEMISRTCVQTIPGADRQERGIPRHDEEQRSSIEELIAHVRSHRRICFSTADGAPFVLSQRPVVFVTQCA